MKIIYEKKTSDFYISKHHKLQCPAHLHHHIELVIMKGGTAHPFIDKVEYTIGKGDAFVCFPNQVHKYESRGEEDYYLIIFAPELIREFNILQGIFPTSPVIRNVCNNEAIQPILDELMKIVNSPKNSVPYMGIRIKGLMLSLMCRIFDGVEFKQGEKENDILHQLLDWCGDNYARDVSLDIAAKELHVSKYYISHIMNDRIGICFNDYINMLRISEAKQLMLDQKLTLTEISGIVGFGSVRTFNRAFRKIELISPRDARKKNL